MKHLIFDMHHLLHRTFFSLDQETKGNKNNYVDTSQKEVSIEELCSFSFHKSLNSMNKHYKLFTPNNVVAVFDTSSWRKDYTNGPNCITHKKYKGNRRKNLTPEKEKQFFIFDEYIKYFKKIIKEKTGILVLEGDKLEADDIIWGFINKHSSDEHIVITGDNDFLQMLKFPNVSVFDPINEKYKDLSEYDNDADYFMFHKCIRGDTGDNVMSSYPRIRSDKIKKAYTDDYTFSNIMEHEFSVDIFDEQGNLINKKYKTKDVFLENLLLMDLDSQPEDIKNKIVTMLDNTTRGKYNMLEFKKFCNDMDLNIISESIMNFTNLLVGKKP